MSKLGSRWRVGFRWVISVRLGASVTTNVERGVEGRGGEECVERRSRTSLSETWLSLRPPLGWLDPLSRARSSRRARLRLTSSSSSLFLSFPSLEISCACRQAACCLLPRAASLVCVFSQLSQNASLFLTPLSLRPAAEATADADATGKQRAKEA